jgi:hypothetical protein
MSTRTLLRSTTVRRSIRVFGSLGFRRRATPLHAVDLGVDLRTEEPGEPFGFGSPFDAGGGTRTPDTRIMIPLL